MRSNKIYSGIASAIAVAGLSAVLSNCSAVGDKSFTANQAALPAMENIALNARSCWFKSGDRDFAAYRLAPELKSFSDKPRILVVPHDSPNERPLLVVEATGNPARIAAYGPLMQKPVSRKINKNLTDWAQGGQKCL